MSRERQNPLLDPAEGEEPGVLADFTDLLAFQPEYIPAVELEGWRMFE